MQKYDLTINMVIKHLAFHNLDQRVYQLEHLLKGGTDHYPMTLNYILMNV